MQKANNNDDDAIKFRTLSTSFEWDNHALFDAFYNGLSEHVKDELVSQELPLDPNAFMDLVGCTDAHLRSQQRERSPGFHQAWASLPSTQEPSSPPEPMQVNLNPALSRGM